MVTCSCGKDVFCSVIDGVSLHKYLAALLVVTDRRVRPETRLLMCLEDKDPNPQTRQRRGLYVCEQTVLVTLHWALELLATHNESSTDAWNTNSLATRTIQVRPGTSLAGKGFHKDATTDPATSKTKKSMCVRATAFPGSTDVTIRLPKLAEIRSKV